MSDIRRLPVLSLTDVVVLPGMVVPIELDEPAQAAVDAAKSAHSSDAANSDDAAASDGIGEVLLAPRLQDRYSAFGVVATIEQVGRLAGGAPAAVLRAGRRARIGTGVTGPGAALWVQAELVDDEPITDRTKALAAEYKSLVIANLQKQDAWQVINTVEKMTDPSVLADAAGWAPYLTNEQKREVLETPDVAARLELLIGWTKAHLNEMDVAEKIRDDVREGMEKSQREFLLRQQLAAIRKELGDGEPEGAEDYRSRVEHADLPDKVRESALREVGRLERSSDQSPESGWIRTWLDTVLELPWTTTTHDKTDVTAAREVLDADHHGLHDVKDRIVEYLAVRSRRAQRGLQVVGGRGSGAVLALVGPPGVGKTSLGESVARALGRKFVRVALGGVRDEAEIRGHRRTYVGALPGRIVRAITEAGSMNPVMLLDEIDKVGSDYRGDPAAALLEVLEPAALDATEVTVTDSALRKLAADYTREAGVRQLERLIAKVFRKVATQLSSGKVESPVTVDEPDLRGLIGRPRFTSETAERTSVPGVATGLAVTGMGGDVLFIEASAEPVADGAEPGKGSSLTLTGQLGDVMKESAQIALSFVRSHPDEVGIESGALNRTIHLHVPAGAVPKDGPSAGVTMVTALTSLATGRPVRSDVAMTGEVTLNGKVLPIGGVKQKLLAAQRAGVTTVFIPLRNEPDLDDVPSEVLAVLSVIPVGDVREILAQALEPAVGSVDAAAA